MSKNPPLKPHFPFLSSSWSGILLLHPHFPSPFLLAQPSCPAPTLLILGCSSELIILSTLLPLKNSVNYKNSVALDIWSRVDNGSSVSNESHTRFSVMFDPGGWLVKGPLSSLSPPILFLFLFLFFNLLCSVLPHLLSLFCDSLIYSSQSIAMPAL